jgi:hypothetical protein
MIVEGMMISSSCSGYGFLSMEFNNNWVARSPISNAGGTTVVRAGDRREAKERLE